MGALMRKRLSVVVLMLVGAITILVAPRIHWSYRLLYNPTESAPKGWYVVKPIADVHVDDFVLVWLPESIASFAAQRKYLPSNVPLLKHVSAVGGDNVCAIAGFLSLNNHLVVRALTHDGAGRPLTAWTGCRVLAPSEVLLLSTTTDDSFDSRYFGPLPRSCIVGRATTIWTWH